MKRHPRAFWETLVAEVESGATVDDLARRYRVRESTLRWWRTQLRRPSRAPSVRLVEVATPRASAVAIQHIEIACGGLVIRVATGTDVDYVAAMVRALSGAC